MVSKKAPHKIYIKSMAHPIKNFYCRSCLFNMLQAHEKFSLQRSSFKVKIIILFPLRDRELLQNVLQLELILPWVIKTNIIAEIT